MPQRTSCHCGAVAAKVDAELTDAIECNCSICRRKGHVLAFVPRAALTLETPSEALSTYRFNKKAIQHHFCKVCGCAPFGEGEMPDGTKMAAINLRCIDGFDLKSITITQVDGASF
jgi:hypothetical protein